MANKKNKFIEFYGKHHISPVHQYIRDFRRHLERRQKLYRLLGLAPAFFRNKTVLEVGPGGGYNALVLFKWGANLDFVEPNPKAQEELPELLKSHKIKKGRWRLYPSRIEDFKPHGKYDIVIAEGFMPGLDNKIEVIAKISELINKGGVVVTTCIDDFSFFFEIVRRVLAQRLLQIKGIKSFPEQVEVLSAAFASHLKSLKYASRPVEDWVADNLLNPATYGTFSIADCLGGFGRDFMPLGSSPAFFTDYSWYKDLNFDSRASFIGQYYKKMHTLLLWDTAESSRPVARNKKLVKEIAEFRRFARKAEKSLNMSEIRAMVMKLRNIKSLAKDLDPRVGKAIATSVKLLLDNELDEFKIAKAGNLVPVFGRGQQYVSLVKNF